MVEDNHIHRLVLIVFVLSLYVLTMFLLVLNYHIDGSESLV